MPEAILIQDKSYLKYKVRNSGIKLFAALHVNVLEEHIDLQDFPSNYVKERLNKKALEKADEMLADYVYLDEASIKSDTDGFGKVTSLNAMINLYIRSSFFD